MNDDTCGPPCRPIGRFFNGAPAEPMRPVIWPATFELPTHHEPSDAKPPGAPSRGGNPRRSGSASPRRVLLASVVMTSACYAGLSATGAGGARGLASIGTASPNEAEQGHRETVQFRARTNTDGEA